ncbi:MAG: hypothetical protein LBS22_02955 [Puniceicoccales bacterium]|nr:hypothetical protein [Puniceicoccales bacterium]
MTKYGPVAIDHDLSFPTLFSRSFADTIKLDAGRVKNGRHVQNAVDGMTPNGYCMLPVMDEDTYALTMAVDLDDLLVLRKKYRKKGERRKLRSNDYEKSAGKAPLPVRLAG